MAKELIEFLIVCLFWIQIVTVTVRGVIPFENHHENASILVRKDERKSLVSAEYGEISVVNISDGAARRHYQLRFITLEPNALFLPVLLHSDMVFYVQTGSGRLSFVVEDEDEVKNVDLQRGDVYRLPQGTVLFMQSHLETSRQKLRICGLFSNPIQEFLHDPYVEAYSSIRDLVLGFDNKVLQAAFNVPAEVIEEITSGAAPPAIVHAPPTKERTFWELEARFMNSLLRRKSYDVFAVNKKHKKTKLFNILEAKPDFENCNGWSLTVTKKDLSALKSSNIGLFMVNLTHGSMMGPHWNPMASEISIVMQGQGMIRVVCPITAAANESGCKNMSFKVGEGDVFVLHRFHPMAQMAFNNDSFVFMGFSTSTKKNHPQYLAGTASVLRTLDREIVAASLNVSNTTVSQLLDPQVESIILGCTSCAEEEERKMEEEIEREKEEERKRREEEEEEKRRKEEEEEEKKRKEEEEEKRRREDEEGRKREEEKRRREEEEAARKKAEEEARKREEEEASRQEKEMEKEMERQEEDARKERERQKEEEKKEEEARRERERQKEEEDKRKEEEAARRERERQKEEEAKGKEEEKSGGGGGGREGKQSRVVVSV